MKFILLPILSIALCLLSSSHGQLVGISLPIIGVTLLGSSSLIGIGLGGGSGSGGTTTAITAAPTTTTTTPTTTVAPTTLGSTTVFATTTVAPTTTVSSGSTVTPGSTTVSARGSSGSTVTFNIGGSILSVASSDQATILAIIGTLQGTSSTTTAASGSSATQLTTTTVAPLTSTSTGAATSTTTTANLSVATSTTSGSSTTTASGVSTTTASSISSTTSSSVTPLSITFNINGQVVALNTTDSSLMAVFVQILNAINNGASTTANGSSSTTVAPTRTTRLTPCIDGRARRNQGKHSHEIHGHRGSHEHQFVPRVPVFPLFPIARAAPIGRAIAAPIANSVPRRALFVAPSVGMRGLYSANLGLKPVLNVVAPRIGL